MVIISVAVFVVIVYTHYRACKGSSFSEGDEDGLVDLAFRVNLDADMEEGHSTEDYQRGDDELGNIFGRFVHMRFFCSLVVRTP